MSVRDRIERAEMEAKYAAARGPQGPTPEQVEQERRDRLAANARKIRENQVNAMLLSMSEDERIVVFELINATRPESLSSADVISATLMRVQCEGTENLRSAMQGSTPDQQKRVWNVLKSATPRERLGMDGGNFARETLRRVQDDDYFGEE